MHIFDLLGNRMSAACAASTAANQFHVVVVTEIPFQKRSDMRITETSHYFKKNEKEKYEHICQQGKSEKGEYIRRKTTWSNDPLSLLEIEKQLQEHKVQRRESEEAFNKRLDDDIDRINRIRTY